MSLSSGAVKKVSRAYTVRVPRLWKDTIEAHRRSVHEAVLEATWRLVCERGLRATTMSQIAEEVGIGRATLYKYFPDVEAILVAYHQQHVDTHVEALTEVAGGPGEAVERLAAVLAQYALICHHRGRHGTDELMVLLHRPEHVADAGEKMTTLLSGIIAEAAAMGAIRKDAEPDELANYCVHALSAAGKVGSRTAVDRLVNLTLAALRPAP